MIRRPPKSTPFPYAPLFRSRTRPRGDGGSDEQVQAVGGRTIGRGVNRGGRGNAADGRGRGPGAGGRPAGRGGPEGRAAEDRKSTRLNSSHSQISYAVFCLKK